jgi:hypothetical protein
VQTEGKLLDGKLQPRARTSASADMMRTSSRCSACHRSHAGGRAVIACAGTMIRLVWDIPYISVRITYYYL